MSEFKNGETFSIYVANLGKYNEGELVGGWITLPKPQAELEQFLRDTVGLELDTTDEGIEFSEGQMGERLIFDSPIDERIELVNHEMNFLIHWGPRSLEGN